MSHGRPAPGARGEFKPTPFTRAAVVAAPIRAGELVDPGTASNMGRGDPHPRFRRWRAWSRLVNATKPLFINRFFHVYELNIGMISTLHNTCYRKLSVMLNSFLTPRTHARMLWAGGEAWRKQAANRFQPAG